MAGFRGGVVRVVGRAVQVGKHPNDSPDPAPLEVHLSFVLVLVRFRFLRRSFHLVLYVVSK